MLSRHDLGKRMNCLLDKEAKLKKYQRALRWFQLTTHPGRTASVVTNDHQAISTSEDATKACAFRGQIEQYHREVKQTMGVAKCQAKNDRAQHKHIMTSQSWLGLCCRLKLWS